MLENQIRDGFQAARARKRGGVRVLFSLDSDFAEAAYWLDPALHDLFAGTR